VWVQAARTDVAKQLLPYVEDDEWFFDTEFLVLAERNGFRIHEVPVDWVDDPDSRVDIVKTARDDLLGLARLCLGRGKETASAPVSELRPSDLPSSLANFARIGAVSTAAYLVLFFLLAGSLGRFGANLLALTSVRRPIVPFTGAHLRPAGEPLRGTSSWRVGRPGTSLVVTSLPWSWWTGLGFRRPW